MQTIVHELPPRYYSQTTTEMNLEQMSVLSYPQFKLLGDLQTQVDEYRTHDQRAEAHGIMAVYIGVLNEAGETVGISSLRFNRSEGELSCLAVLPEASCQGIGTWLVNERVRRAKAMGLRALYIGQLAKTNTLKNYYREIGFVDFAANDQVEIFAYKDFSRRNPQLVYRI